MKRKNKGCSSVGGDPSDNIESVYTDDLRYVSKFRLQKTGNYVFTKTT